MLELLPCPECNLTAAIDAPTPELPIPDLRVMQAVALATEKLVNPKRMAAMSVDNVKIGTVTHCVGIFVKWYQDRLM